MTAKTKKILNIILDVVIAIILVFAAFIAVMSIRSKAKHYGQYTEFFGTAYLAVASSSMECEGVPDYVPEGKLEGFDYGDLIKIKLLNEDEINKLEVGDIITYQTSSIVNGTYVLNTHRIVEINTDSEGKVTTIVTKGDNPETNPINDAPVSVDKIVGLYQGKSGGIGHLFLFMSSTGGFIVFILIPTLIIVAICVVNLVMVIKKEKKVQVAEAELEKDAERERIRAELLAEMQASQGEQSDQAGQGEETDQSAPDSDESPKQE
ncbi:MAG: hypothetical protein ACI4MN_07110 [Candidatus Coproplasma sp.]